MNLDGLFIPKMMFYVSLKIGKEKNRSAAVEIVKCLFNFICSAYKLQCLLNP